MDPGLKKYLIKTFLMNKFPYSYQESWLTRSNYAFLGDAIEYLHGLGDLSTIQPGHPMFAAFLSTVNAGVMFSKELPPNCIKFSQKHLDQYQYEQRDLWGNLPHLPNSNYTTRKTAHVASISDGEFFGLKALAVQTLLDIAKAQMPTISLNSLEDFNKAITEHKKLVDKEKNPILKKRLKNELGLLKDLNKAANLSIIEIPKEDGTPVSYCILAESAGGVTEKKSLIKLDEVKTQLQNIQRVSQNLDFNTYIANRDNYELKTQAILKLPKHGKTTEVQREATALNISRILGLNTTKSTMVEYKGKAALFVPFDKIQLMKKFAKGEKQTIIVPSSFTMAGVRRIGDNYLHHSTVVPVGNRLHPDQILEDFGAMMAFSHLCNDPDFVGMKNQNKAIKDGSKLYIFDQVIRSDEKFEFDTRLSLLPVGRTKNSRHNQGRNRTIIEDSSFDSKFNSVVNLLNNHAQINYMLDNLYFTHNSKIHELKSDIQKLEARKGLSAKDKKSQLSQLKAQVTELEILKKDASEIKKTVNSRIQTMFKNFPSLNGQAMTPELFLANQTVIKQSLILEKLVNKPVLFAEDGRPYKNPWTQRNTNKIAAIFEKNGEIYLSFDSLNVKQIVSILERSGIDPKLCFRSKRNPNMLIIPATELTKIHENSLFPERGYDH